MLNSMTIHQYIELIEYIKEIHDEYNKNIFIDKNIKKINLKRKQIRDLYSEKTVIDSEYRQYMDVYLEQSNKLTNKLDRYSLNKELTLIHRPKNMQSIYDKVVRKMEDSNGSYSINKYLNDLIGVRVIDSKVSEKIDEIDKKILKDNKIYTVKEHKEPYIGYHIYYRGYNNYCYPIELQIWDIKNMVENQESHKDYKERYMSNIKDYKQF